MNSDKPKHRRQRGNAMIYILLSLGLIGGLTAVMSNQAQQGGDNVDQEQAQLMATQVMNYASSAKLAIDGMLTSGTRPEDISFVRPNEAGYSTGATINQFYHPNGGGFNHKAADPKIFTGTSTNPVAGWYVARFNNVAWTPTSTNDIIITAYQISEPICKVINKRIMGSTTIPTLGGSGSMSEVFLGTANGSTADVNFTAAECAACVGYPAMCVANSTNTAWSFYSIISAQ